MSLVLILDSSQTTSQSIELYCEMLGYESVTSHDLSMCDAFHGDNTCLKKEQCVDILFIDHSIVKDADLEVIETQIERGCKIQPRCKALIANSLSDHDFKRAIRLGYHVLQKPVTFEILESWLSDVEWQSVETLKSSLPS